MSESSKPHSLPSPHRPLRNMLALVLLSMATGCCFALGLWQLERAAERDALHQAIEHGRQQAPLTLSAFSAAADFLPWRPATAQGRWSPEHTVLLQNRNLHGQPGYWVATPLLLTPPAPPANRHDAVSAGSAEPDAIGHGDGAPDFLGRGPAVSEAAVLVLRGWLPRDMQAGGAAPDIPAEHGIMRVSGELHSHVPRIFELWEWAGGESSHLPDALPQTGSNIPQVQNLDLAAYARATGLNLLP
ncbi:MAG: SURF1 family protein, partial [Alcaligenaceae bacterium]|nr:SURF1 family protein [Alcaligenaceae bacterium]